MRILYIHQYFCTRKGRSGTRSYEFARYLLRQGHRVTMLTSTSDLSDLRIPEGSRVHRCQVEGIDVIAVRIPYSQRMGTLGRIWSFVRFMVASTWIACRERGHDVIFATSTPLTVGLPAWLASRVNRIPFVFEVRDLWPEAPVQMGVIRNRLLIGLLRAFERLIYAKAAHLVALSPGMRDGVVHAGVPPEKVAIVPNCSDLDLFRPGDARPETVRRFGLEGKFVVTHAGSMGAANGLETLLEAAAHLQEADASDVRLLLVGQGARADALREQARARGLDNLVFTGGMPREEVAELLRATHVALVLFRNLPVLATNSPNKLFDALAAGRPVIVNSNGWTRVLVEQHQVGRYAEAGSGAALARQILWMRDHPAERSTMARRARRLAEAEFDRQKLAAEIERILTQVVRGEPVVQGTTDSSVRPSDRQREALRIGAPSLDPVGSSAKTED